MSVELLAAITVSVVTVIGALVTGVLSIIVATRTKETVDRVAVETQSQTAKLENITVLVDGRYSEVLQELATVRALLAQQSGLVSDAIKADHAQKEADDQQTRVDAAEKGSTL